VQKGKKEAPRREMQWGMLPIAQAPEQMQPHPSLDRSKFNPGIIASCRIAIQRRQSRSRYYPKKIDIIPQYLQIIEQVLLVILASLGQRHTHT
jgi:hypothetical protein